MAVECAGAYPLEALLVEDAASGQSLLQELKAESLLPVVGIRPDRDKFSRAAAIEPLVQGGRLFLPDGDSPWISDFIAELCSFPAGRNDDFVDALSQGVNYLRWQPDTSFVIEDFDEWFQRMAARTAGAAALPADWISLRTRPVFALPGETESDRRDRELRILANISQSAHDPISRAACVAEVRRLHGEIIVRS
jgi:Terminase RNaseH-like domain